MMTVQMGEAAEIILASAVMMICRSDIVEDSWEGSMSMRTEDMCLSPEVNTRVSMIMTRPMTIILKRDMQALR